MNINFINYEKKIYGNIIDQDLLQIWNSEEMKAQREEIRQHKNACICWTQSTAFNAFLDDVPFSKNLPILNRKQLSEKSSSQSLK